MYILEVSGFILLGICFGSSRRWQLVSVGGGGNPKPEKPGWGNRFWAWPGVEDSGWRREGVWTSR